MRRPAALSNIEPLQPRFSCPDWWQRLERGETPMAEVPLDEVQAARALAFFNRLKLPDVAGLPPLREACGDWFREILCAFLASADPATGERLVWELLCMVPKKNSKTTYVAALGLTALYLEAVHNRQMLIIGPSQNIAQRCFTQAQGMIRADPMLTRIFSIQDNTKTITRRTTGTRLTVKTFDTSIVTGEIPVLTIIDELHELGKKNGAAEVMQQIRGGGITKKGGQVLMITTQSDGRPTGIWRTELQKARAIRDGRGGRSPIMLPVLYEFPEDLQKDEGFWRDRDNWPLILPNLERSISRRRLEDDYDNNGSVTAEAEQIWVSQHLNIEIGLGLHKDRWPGADHWEEAAEPMGLEELLEVSEVITLGIDPGGYDDLLGVAVLGRHMATGNWHHWGKAFADRIVLERRKQIAAELLRFEEAGDLVLVDDLEVEGYDLIAALAGRIRAAKKLPDEDGIGIDAAGKAAGLVLDALENVGFDAKKDIRAVAQGYRLNNVVGLCAIKLKARSLRHAGQPIMTWCVENARMEVSKNAEIITKAESGAGKIDPLMALFNAAELMSLHPEPANRAISIPANYEVA